MPTNKTPHPQQALPCTEQMEESPVLRCGSPSAPSALSPLLPSEPSGLLSLTAAPKGHECSLTQTPQERKGWELPTAQPGYPQPPAKSLVWFRQPPFMRVLALGRPRGPG